MSPIDEFYFRNRANRRYAHDRSRGAAIETTPTRFIAVELTEGDWQTLRTIQPEPTIWMKQQIQQMIERHRQNERLDRAVTDRLRWSEK
jgi:hypothetical protein